ncbi:hypothetical protein [Streptomyces sp. CRN 30]|uniref:hypothetical protein n=1 Tax=Streptomyces sp. CRN 30 TaxID=3075613 RepID=UPI002A8169C3|nr:hypothetical protein [Streptomyces sp. CRN 30]
MGNSGDMNVTNNRSTDLRLFILGVNCMYDNGDEGSDLSAFNNTVVSAGTTFPGGNGQFIETKNSGGCFGETSTFTLKVVDDSTHTEIGHIDFTEDGGWGATSSNPDVIDVDIDGSENPSPISVTVEAT